MILKSSSRRSLSSLFPAFLVVLLLALGANAQPGEADTIFAEAKKLAAEGTLDSRLASLTKFETAATLYTSAGAKAKFDEVTLEHGKTLRQLGNYYIGQQDYGPALRYLEMALPKLQSSRDYGEIALALHDLGYVSDQLARPTRSAEYYDLSLAAYRQAGDRGGEATVLRNQGVRASAAERWDVALEKFNAALKIRIATAEQPAQAELRNDLGDTYFAQKKYPESIREFAEALRLYRILKDRTNVAWSVFRLGAAQAADLKYDEAAKSLAEARVIFQELGDRGAEISVIWRVGRINGHVGRYADAEYDLFRVADYYKAAKDEPNEAGVLLDIASNYLGWSRMGQAATAIQRALELFRKLGDRRGQANAMLIQSDIEGYLNQHANALANIQKAKAIYEELKDEAGRFSAIRSMVAYHYTLSNYGQAIKDADVMLKDARQKGEPLRELDMLVLLGSSYSALGQHERSLECTGKALQLALRLRSPVWESIVLNNIGYTYWKMNRLPEARNQFLQAIALQQRLKLGREEAYARHNLGLTYYKMKDYRSALAEYDRALPLYLAAGDRRPEAFLYDSYGEIYRDLGDYDRSLLNLQKAIVLAREIRYSEIEGNALANMMKLWSQRGQSRLAVLYGKQAVNVYQNLRAGNRLADKAAQKSLLESNEATYRRLANILIDQGRLAEAQQVLDLLKAEEYFEFIRRDSNAAGEHAALALTESERKALEEYSRVSGQLTAIGATFQALQDKRNRAGGKLAEAEEAEYLKLKLQVEAAGEGIKTFFTKLASEFSKTVEDGTVVTPQSIETLKADLRRSGSDVVLVSTYLLPERYRAIVTTGRTMVDRKVEYSAAKLTGADINRKIFEFQRALQNPAVDPRKLGKELYDIFVKPLEEDLRGAGAKTILWSLDGSLRYIPIAALSPDGKTYLADRYQNVVVTLGRQTNLFTRPSADEWRAIGAGVSKPHAGFSALPSVPGELGSIVRDASHTAGVLEGTRMLDEQFNLESLRNTVPQQTEDGKPFNVLHLATHFSLGANDQDSALLLGDGKRLSLFEIGRDEALDFKDVELLTLSACQTGVSTGDANGREVESLGMLAQKKGAKAVLATLWKVADESTALFMAEFYRIKKANPGMNKAEAIRQAQKAMIDGRIKSSGSSNACRGDAFVSGPKQNEFKCDPNAPYSHPYFWSPFVLIGNWR